MFTTLSKTKQYFTLFIFMLSGMFTTGNASNFLTVSRDSLLCLLHDATTYERKLELLTHLSDIDLLQDKYNYTLQLWNLALQNDDQEAMSIAIRPLTLRYLDVCQLDSADVWLKKCRIYLKGDRREEILQYLEMMRDIRNLSERKELGQRLLADTLKLDKNKEPYQYMRRLYCLGAIAMMTPNDKTNLKPWDNYMKEGLEIAQKIPLEKDYLFRTQFLVALSVTGTDYTRQLMEVYKEYRQLPSIKKRIFSSHRTEITAITRMLSHGKEIGRQQMDYYFKEFNRLVQLYPDDVAPPLDFFYYYYALYYYDYIQDYPKAIECCDSVIKNAPKYGMENLYQYEDKSKYLAKLKRWEEAYNSICQYITVKDSVDSKNIFQEIAELQAQYDVNKLELDKANLMARQRGIFLIFIGIILLILAGWTVYISRTLRITRHLKQNL
ncbi:hypothetical protein [Bacteroides sp.]